MSSVRLVEKASPQQVPQLLVNFARLENFKNWMLQSFTFANIVSRVVNLLPQQNRVRFVWLASTKSIVLAPLPLASSVLLVHNSQQQPQHAPFVAQDRFKTVQLQQVLYVLIAQLVDIL